MKKMIMIFLFSLLVVVGLPVVTEAAESVDATDATIFGAQAMVPNSTEDQTDNLQALLSQTAKKGQALFLPQGSYALSKDIAISSNYQLIGDTEGATVLHNVTGAPIQLTDTTYGTKTNVRLQNIAFDGINVTLKLTNQLTLANNIFYNLLKEFVVNLNADIGVKISGNIFMRYTAHMQSGSDFNRAIYIGGYSTPSRFQYMSDVDIVDNLFGLKVTELDAIKSTSRFEAFKKAFKNKKIELTDEEIRKPMGMLKLDHIKQLLTLDNVKKQWFQIYGKYSDETDADNIYHDFEKYLFEDLGKNSSLKPDTKQ